MAIRIRKVKGHTVALCAAVTRPMPRDQYLDDAAHHALTCKFERDFESMGFMADPPNKDEPEWKIMDAIEVPGGNHD